MYFFFFFIDLSCYLSVGYLESICKFLEREAKYINFRAKIKILLVNIHTSIYIFFFSKVGGAWSPSALE